MRTPLIVRQVWARVVKWWRRIRTAKRRFQERHLPLARLVAAPTSGDPRACPQCGKAGVPTGRVLGVRPHVFAFGCTACVVSWPVKATTAEARAHLRR